MKRTCKTCNPARYCPDRGTVEVCAQWVADPDDERFIHPGTYAEIDATAIAGIGLLPGTPESDALVNKMIDDSRLVVLSEANAKFIASTIMDIICKPPRRRGDDLTERLRRALALLRRGDLPIE